MSPPPDAVAFDPLLLFGVAGAAAPVALRLRQAGAQASAWRWGSLAVAVVLLAAVLLSPLQTLAEHYLLTAHLLQVLVLMGGAPPLLLLALPRTPPLWRAPDPLPRLGRFLVHPVVAITIVNAVFFLTHWTAVFDYETGHWWLFDLGLLALLGASVSFWWPIVSPGGRTFLLSPLGKLGYILLATIPQTFAGLLLAMAPRLLYTVYLTAPRVLDMSAKTDQQIAGACLAILSKIALFAAFSVIFVHVMNPGSDGDDGGGGGGPQHEPVPPPPGEPAWYRAMERGQVRPEPVPPQPRVAIPRQPAGSAGSR